MNITSTLSEGLSVGQVAVIKTAQRLGILLREIAEEFKCLPITKSPATEQWKQMSLNWRSKLQARIDKLEFLKDPFPVFCIRQIERICSRNLSNFRFNK